MGEIFYNGLVLSEKLKELSVVVDRGLILDLGDRHSMIKKYKGFKEFDLSGGVLLPAILDEDSNSIGYSAKLFSLDLEKVRSMEDLLSLIKLHISDNCIEDEAWIVCKNFDKDGNGFMPKRWDLDLVSEKNPLLIVNKFGTSGSFNTKALNTLTTEAMMEEDGILEVKKGYPTGYMEGRPFLVSIRQIPGPGMEEVRSLLESKLSIESCQQFNIGYSLSDLSKGERADFMVLSDNPLEFELENLGKLSLVTFYKEGKAIFKDVKIDIDYR